LKPEARDQPAGSMRERILAHQLEREDKRIDQCTERIAIDLVGQFGIQNYNQSRMIVLNVLDHFFSMLEEQNVELTRLTEQINRDRYLTTEVVNQIAESLVDYLQLD